MLNTTGGGSMRFKRIELLGKLKANRAMHEQAYAAALVEFRKRYVEKLDDLIVRAKGAKEIRLEHLNIGLPLPEQHTEDYDRVIEMLAMSPDELIELDESGFDKLVRDKWEWERSFRVNTTSYGGR